MVLDIKAPAPAAVTESPRRSGRHSTKPEPAPRVTVDEKGDFVELVASGDIYTVETAKVGIPEGWELRFVGEFRKWRVVMPIVSFPDPGRR